MKKYITVIFALLFLGVASGEATQLTIDFGTSEIQITKNSQNRFWSNGVWNGLGHKTLKLKELGEYASLAQTPVSKPAPTEAELSEREKKLRELGLEDDANSRLFLTGGIIMIVLGLSVIGASIWYYLRPEHAPKDVES